MKNEYSIADKCTQICGDGKFFNITSNYSIDGCDDGNTVSGDGCSSACLVEHGYQCVQGNIYAPAICTEICGDGIDLGHYQCDDGNT